jgi:tetratricopeptide (TPR) repeat protein
MGGVIVTLGHQQKHISVFIYVGIVVATLVAYEPIRHNGFVTYDDGKYIYENPMITGGISLQSLGEAFTKPHFFMWHPLTTLSHMLDYQLFGLNPSGHHLVSVLLHIANALLLFWVLNSITGSLWASAFVAAVFALHPLQVESVAWAAERKTELSGLFWLLTTAAYIRYARKPGFGRYMLLLFVFGLCIMTKPVVVTLPFALLLLDYWPFERIRWGQKDKTAVRTTSNQKSAGWLIAEKIPLLAMSAILAVITLIAQQSVGTVQTLKNVPLDYRVANMFVSYIRYIGKMLWPSQLAVLYPHPQSGLPKTITLICVLLFILISFGVYAGRRRRYIVMGWLWYIGTLVPVIGLVQSGAQAMANRYMYIPMLGLLIIIACAAKDLVASRGRMKIVATILAAVLLSALVILTHIQVGHWQNSITLYEYTLKVTKNNALVENNYGSALLGAGRLDEASLHLNKALSIIPELGEAEANLGKVYLKQGKFNEAISCFKRVLELGAITHFKYALQTNKISADAHVNLGSAYIQVGKYDLAIQNLTRAIELKPDNIEVLNKLAWLLAAVDDASIHNAQKAVEFAQRGCELTSYKDPMLLDTLAVAYAAAGRFEAKATAEKALNIAKETGRENLVVGIQERIKFYEAGQPYRQK